MAAFGVSFPKLTFCRSAPSKIDPNNVSSTTAPAGSRTLSLSIKNVPSQPIHFDVSTTSSALAKKKTTSIATILAIDGETKQLPRNLSVFNELQFDCEARDIDEQRRHEGNSSDVIVPSSLSPMANIDHRADIRFLANVDSKPVFSDSKDQDAKHVVQERPSNHTFTPPTSTLSNQSSAHDLHQILSSISVDLPQLNYAIEKFLVDEDNPVYHVLDEFPPILPSFQQGRRMRAGSSSHLRSLHDLDHHTHVSSSNQTASDLPPTRTDRVGNAEIHSTSEKHIHDDKRPSPPSMSHSMKWYVSELRINRPLIYRTQWNHGLPQETSRKLSHSFDDLNDAYVSKSRTRHCTQQGNSDGIAHSALSLQNFAHPQQPVRHQSDESIPLENHLSCTDEDFNRFQSDEDNQSPSPIPRTLGRSIGRDDTLIRNESVKQKLFDILNDDELENACLEDMSQEFENMTLAVPSPPPPFHHHRHELPNVNSFSSSSDDALYSSPPDELHVPVPSVPLLSSSYDGALSAHMQNTAERYFGRSRLVTTSLDKFPLNNNAYEHPFSPSFLRPSYELARPSWYTSPSPHWRLDEQQTLMSRSKGHASNTDDHFNRLLRNKASKYQIQENKYMDAWNSHDRNEPKHIGYSSMNTSTPLLTDSSTMFPIIQDTTSNLLMFM